MNLLVISISFARPIILMLLLGEQLVPIVAKSNVIAVNVVKLLVEGTFLSRSVRRAPRWWTVALTRPSVKPSFGDISRCSAVIEFESTSGYILLGMYGSSNLPTVLRGALDHIQLVEVFTVLALI